MSTHELRMTYHPAMKEIKFERFQSGKKIPIPPESKLVPYMNDWQFVLQDKGNRFLDDIAKTFSGEKVAHIQVITTKYDYEDFVQMVDFYNSESDIKINATLIAELKDMDSVYIDAVRYGQDTIKILSEHIAEFSKLTAADMRHPAVETTVNNFSEGIQDQIKSIEGKIDSLADNTVNLCFTGVYSAGKSALINAILGYAILPENIKSTTARMFRIQSPRKGEGVHITFAMSSPDGELHHTELLWQDNKFVFKAGPAENASRRAIQEKINDNAEKPQYRQIYAILEELNKDQAVSIEIQIYFPVPLDSDGVQFTIFDTPGTDSDYSEHHTVLQNALSKQTHSILIFVAAPTKTEGEGNRHLLQLINEAEKNKSETSIDIGRSLFVMNWADSIGPDERGVLQTTEIKLRAEKRQENTSPQGIGRSSETQPDRDIFSIKLRDKKLFFTSAKIAYAAKAIKTDIAENNEKYIYRQHQGTINDPEFGRYYQQNHYGSSEFLTAQMIRRSEEALRNAEKANDVAGILHVCSGLYALENEIVIYGEKYAVAVRANAIINSVDKALTKIKDDISKLASDNKKNIEDVGREIKKVEEAVRTAIQNARATHTLTGDTELRDSALRQLHLDQEYITRVFITDPKESIKSKLYERRTFIFGNIPADPEDNIKMINDCVRSILIRHTSEFIQARRSLLEKNRDKFIYDIKAIIRNNGDLNSEAEAFILDIKEIPIADSEYEIDFDRIYENSIIIKPLLIFWKRKYVNVDALVEGVVVKLTEIADDRKTIFEKDFHDSHADVLEKVETEFKNNLHKYSAFLRASIEDKERLEKLQEDLKKAEKDVTARKEEFLALIWREKESV